MKEKETSKYKIIPDKNGNRYEFFCDLSDALVCTTNVYKNDDAEKELILAWETEARELFNRCQKCGRWIIDAMYNPDVLSCVCCVPLEEYPEFCPQCGAQTKDIGYFCHICGTRLLYGGEIENEKTKSNQKKSFE